MEKFTIVSNSLIKKFLLISICIIVMMAFGLSTLAFIIGWPPSSFQTYPTYISTSTSFTTGLTMNNTTTNITANITQNRLINYLVKIKSTSNVLSNHVRKRNFN
jgi:hypothetical protein